MPKLRVCGDLFATLYGDPAGGAPIHERPANTDWQPPCWPESPRVAGVVSARAANTDRPYQPSWPDSP